MELAEVFFEYGAAGHVFDRSDGGRPEALQVPDLRVVRLGVFVVELPDVLLHFGEIQRSIQGGLQVEVDHREPRHGFHPLPRLRSEEY